MKKKTYSVKETAKKLGCTRSNVYRLIDNGQLKAKPKPVAVELRITEAEIKKYLDGHKGDQ